MNKKPIPKLIKQAEKVFNAYIRMRDKDKGCISCGKPIDHAGHYFSAGHYSGLRFVEYGIGLVNRYGTTYHIELLKKSRENKLRKWSRSELEEIIQKYKAA